MIQLLSFFLYFKNGEICYIGVIIVLFTLAVLEFSMKCHICTEIMILMVPSILRSYFLWIQNHYIQTSSVVLSLHKDVI